MPDLLLTGLCWFLAIQFFIFAPLKFYPGKVFGQPSYLDKFEAWGYPRRFSFVVGAGEILAAIMLILPSQRFLGAVIIVITMVGAIVTHQINHDKLSDSLAAPVLFVLATVVALSTWPSDWREPLPFASEASVHARSYSHIESAAGIRTTSSGIPLQPRSLAPTGIGIPSALPGTTT